VKLFSHQERVVQRMLTHRGTLVFHSMGSGKTTTALATAYALRDRNVIDNVVIIAPTSVQGYWQDNAAMLGLSAVTEVFTHNNNVTDIVSDRTLLIVDEAHNFRTIIVKNATRSLQTQKAFHMINAAARAGKVMLLSGTPIVNEWSDLKNILYALEQRTFDYGAYKKYQACVWRVAPVTDAYNMDDDPRLPTSTQETVSFEMEPDFLAWYDKVEKDVVNALCAGAVTKKNLTVFLNGVRRAVNGCSWKSGEGVLSPKVGWVGDHIMEWKGKQEKTIIYSAWNEFGVDIVKGYLISRDPSIRVGVINGSLSAHSRHEVVSDFNRNKLDVLIFTAAGSEGINLMGTRHVVILEPHWNNARIKQAVHRACRVGSHSHLPAEERNVKIYRLVLEKPAYAAAERESADNILTSKANDKDFLCTKLYMACSK
jgi:SNF2 family DNA or RNA helicase